MEQKLSDTLVKAIDRSNPMMQNLQLASRFNKLVEEGGGGADLEDNKEATIDVSAYTDPVEITPTQGKDGMKKVTVSLSNMPAGANMLYAWNGETPASGQAILYFPFDKAPVNASALLGTEYLISLDNVNYITKDEVDDQWNLNQYNRISDSEFFADSYFTRDATKDIEVWNAPPEVETTKQATIDVSTYDPANKPVITPTAGKQSMAEVEVTLDNIPSGGSTNVYYWSNENGAIHYYTDFDKSPATQEEFNNKKYLVTQTHAHVQSMRGEIDNYQRISDTEFSGTWDGDPIRFHRFPTYDFTIW